MEFELIKRATPLLDSALRAIVLVLLSSIALAQNIQLSPEQQMMLNQLPPAQRQQAMDAIRQLDSQQQTSQQSINETISEFSPPDDNTLVVDEEARAEARSRVVLQFDLGEDLPVVDPAGIDGRGH